MSYRLYFFSSNLDHYIHNNANMIGNQKVSSARVFSNSYYEDPVGYSSFFGVGNMESDDWLTSWDTVRTGMNSILRGTNYGILINDLLEYKHELEQEG